MNAQTLNLEITKEGQQPYLLGKIDKKGLQGENYNSWFTKNYEDYEPNEAVVSAIASELKTYSIKLFMGTWCGDSKQEVPRLYKVLEACNFPMEQLSVVAVSRQASMYKQSPEHEEAGLNIHRVPTIIFYKNFQEVNRIVEHPIQSFEEDIKNIINVNDYKSNYQIVTAIDEILKIKGLEGLKKSTKKLLSAYKGKVTSMNELNTYGYILVNTNRKYAAVEVFQLNTQLFPEQPRTYMSLANTFGVTGQKSNAIKVLEEAIEMHPNNTDLQENLEVIKSN
jgi:thiol-disulfide isomerase/thioredoxin